ncbi:hypothetical protein C8R43DRAFT_965826 [Mycena crocata]|nr:hypothetical protein C8R43DRAFT_965826 [Mycena crocata]
MRGHRQAGQLDFAGLRKLKGNKRANYGRPGSRWLAFKVEVKGWASRESVSLKEFSGTGIAKFSIYSYTAPEESDSGEIRIFLNGSADYWNLADADPSPSAYGKPASGPTPRGTQSMYTRTRWKSLFGVTGYAEQLCETQLLMFSRLLESEAMRPGSVMGRVPGAPSAEACRRAASNGWDYPIKLNPFMPPGQRLVPTKLPNVSL